MASIEDVRTFWEQHPLLAYEFAGDVGSPEYFELLMKAKREDSDRFAASYWNFTGYRGKRVLDVGCGPGYLTVQYALGGAKVASVDLTKGAVELTRKHLAYRNCAADVRIANAEQLPFPDDYFDMVFSSGVLHHTPDTLRAFCECHRVLKPGSEAKITLYRQNFLLRPPVFQVTKALMRLAAVRHPGADLARTSQNVECFIRQYDGADNPIGIGKENRDWARDLQNCGFVINGWENHFFPKRFIPGGSYLPPIVHRLLDRWVGTMVYFNLVKPQENRLN